MGFFCFVCCFFICSVLVLKFLFFGSVRRYGGFLGGMVGCCVACFGGVFFVILGIVLHQGDVLAPS